jgi:hypothetical protein
MIDEVEFERAGNDLERANDMLESIRQSLYRDRNSGSSLANSTEKEVDVQARRLSNVADRFERDAYGILEDNPGQSVNATIQTVLGLISEARRNIENEDYTAARGNLSEAFSALDQAKHMMNEGSNEHDDQDSGEDSKGPSGGEEKEENGESGNNSTDSGENRGSGKDNEDDDQ